MDNFLNLMFGPTVVPQADIRILNDNTRIYDTGINGIQSAGILSAGLEARVNEPISTPSINPLDAAQASMPNTGNIPVSAIPDIGQVARDAQASQENTAPQTEIVEETPHRGSSEGAPADTTPSVTSPVSFPDITLPDIEKARDVDIVYPHSSRENATLVNPDPPRQIGQVTLSDDTGSQEGSVVPATIQQVKPDLDGYIVKSQAEYKSARQAVINECNAILNEPLTSSEAAKYQALRQIAEDNPDMLKSFINIANGSDNVAGWVHGAVEAFLDPQTHTTTDQVAFAGASFDHMRATEADQVALNEGRHAAEAKTAAYKHALDSYDPKAADAESAKATLKKLSDANNEYKKNLTRTWAKVQAKKVATTPKIEDYRMTLSQQFVKAAGTSTEFISDANSYGHGKALVNGIKKMSKIQAAGVLFHTAGIAVDIHEHWDDIEYALITKDGPMIDKLKNIKSNVSQDTWNTFAEDTIDTTILAIDLVAGAMLTPLGGAALGVFVLHPLGALAKTVYYKNEYGDSVDFGKTFLENLKLGNHDHFVLKSQDTTDIEDYWNDFTLKLYGYISEEDNRYDLAQNDNSLYSDEQDIILKGYVNDTELVGEAQEIILNGNIDHPRVNNSTDGLIIHGDDVYNPVGDPPPIMFPDTDVTVSQAANGCVSIDEPEPDLGLTICTPAEGCVSELELPPDIDFAEDVDIFSPPVNARDVAIVTPIVVKGAELIATDPVWPSTTGAIDEYVTDENVYAPPDLGAPSVLIGPSFYELPERDLAVEPAIIEPTFSSVGPVRNIGTIGPTRG